MQNSRCFDYFASICWRFYSYLSKNWESVLPNTKRSLYHYSSSLLSCIKCSFGIALRALNRRNQSTFGGIGRISQQYSVWKWSVSAGECIVPRTSAPQYSGIIDASGPPSTDTKISKAGPQQPSRLSSDQFCVDQHIDVRPRKVQ